MEGRECHLRDIGEAQDDRPGAGRRVEALAFEQILLKVLQVRPRRANDCVRARRRNDTARSTNEQRIVERLAQPAQRLADGGLAHSELARRAAHTQLVVEGDGDRQQIEIGVLRYQPRLPPSDHGSTVSETLTSCAWQET
jgi:hypothetical protein